MKNFEKIPKKKARKKSDNTRRARAQVRATKQMYLN